MRPRSTPTVLAAGLVLVPLLLAGGVLAWALTLAEGERREARDLVATTQRTTLAADLYPVHLEEVTALAGLGAFPEDVPATLQGIVLSGEAQAAVSSRAVLLDQLERADQRGEELLRELEAMGVPLSPPQRTVLQRLPRGAMRELREGGSPPLPVQAYDVAAVALVELTGQLQEDAERAARDLDRLVSGPPSWEDPSVLVAAIAAAAFGVLSVALLRRRLLAESAELRDEAVRLGARSTDLEFLVGAGRRLTAELEPSAVGGVLACDAATLVGAELALVVLSGDGGAPQVVGVHGDARVDVTRLPYGFLGRLLETGQQGALGPVVEAALPAEGIVTMLGAPLVAERRIIGAVVAARRGDAPFDDDDQRMFPLLALMAGSAVRAAEVHQSTAALSLRDPLTGLANRRRFDADLDEGGAQPPVAVVMLDVDHFKRVNDTHGHATGDALLRALAERVGGAVRAGDVVYRLGGEELAVLLPACSQPEALQVAERIRAAVEAAPLPGGDTQPGGRVTVSVGVAWSDREAAAALVEPADEALYEAKGSGRNKVVAAR